MKIKRVALAVLSLSALSQQTALAAPNGPFIGIMGGANFSRDEELSGLTLNRSVDTDTGWAAVPSIGYRYGNGMRTELELGYRKNDVDGISGADNADGEIKAKSIMLNLLYDFYSSSRIRPYLGAGIGYATVKYDNVNPVGLGGITDKDDVFAYQAMAGVSYSVSPALDLAAEYRYFATRDPDLRSSTGAAFESEYRNHAVIAGLRVNFGAAKTPKIQRTAQVTQVTPVTPPQQSDQKDAAELPRNFQVFFDWDRSDLSSEAESILNEAGNYAKANQPVRVLVEGHADRSGTDDYNQALSMRRANTVKQKLLAMGVAENEISLEARGEQDPLVPTDDGVREAQNRRVEVILQ